MNSMEVPWLVRVREIEKGLNAEACVESVAPLCPTAPHFLPLHPFPVNSQKRFFAGFFREIRPPPRIGAMQVFPGKHKRQTHVAICNKRNGANLEIRAFAVKKDVPPKK